MFRKRLSYRTTRKTEIRTITDDLHEVIAESGIRDGTLLVYSLHTTMSLIIQETSEPFLCEDLIDHLIKTVEDDGMKYKHRCALHPSGTCEEDRFNGPSHIRQMLTNQNLILDFCEGKLSLGRWQDVALLELDGPRENREILVKVIPDPK